MRFFPVANQIGGVQTRAEVHSKHQAAFAAQQRIVEVLFFYVCTILGKVVRNIGTVSTNDWLIDRKRILQRLMIFNYNGTCH